MLAILNIKCFNEIMNESGADAAEKDILWGKWDPKEYLDTFFREIGPDTQETLKFINRELEANKNHIYESALDFGSGPTPIISLAIEPYVQKIDIADFLPSNLAEIKKWLKNEPNAFNWDSSLREILKIEGHTANLESLVRTRSQNLREKAYTILCDASLKYPLKEPRGQYPLVLSVFCADSATSSKNTWREYMHNISNLVAPTGKLLVAALKKCKSYRVGNNFFPSANIDEGDLENLFDDSFIKSEQKIESCNTESCAEQGFENLLFARFVKKS